MTINSDDFNPKEELGAVSIRPLSPQDEQEFWTLRLHALQAEPGSFGASYEESITLTGEERRARLTLNDDRFVLGAFRRRNSKKLELIGTIGFYRHSGAKVKHKGTIWGMYVASEARGLGLGRRLLQEAINRAALMPGLDFINLSVVTDNDPAYRLYASAGFETYGREKAALRVNGKEFDEYMMSLALQADK